MEKGTSQAEAIASSENIKPVALAIVELWESEGIKQAVSKLVSQSVRKFCYIIFGIKFHSNFLKVFWINLKGFSGLVLLTNAALSSSRKIVTDFR